MTGYTEIRYDEEKKRIVVEPLEMTQAFRNFRGGSSAWEQVGPGDDLKPESVSTLYLVIIHCEWPSDLCLVQTTDTKAGATEGRRAEEIDHLDLEVYIPAINVPVRHLGVQETVKVCVPLTFQSTAGIAYDRKRPGRLKFFTWP